MDGQPRDSCAQKRLLVEKQPNSLRIFARRVDTMLKLAESAYFRLIFFAPERSNSIYALAL